MKTRDTGVPEDRVWEALGYTLVSQWELDRILSSIEAKVVH